MDQIHEFDKISAISGLNCTRINQENRWNDSIKEKGKKKENTEIKVSFIKDTFYLSIIISI